MERKITTDIEKILLEIPKNDVHELIRINNDLLQKLT